MERESARLESRKNAAELEEKQILDRLWDTYELTRSSASAAAAELESTAAGTKRAAELRKKISGLGHAEPRRNRRICPRERAV